MIKFFRHLRQQLIIQNKMGKYFKYAIGEVLLVVIGILIALQINNWNEQKKLDKLKVVYVDKLIKDLKADIQNNKQNRKDVERLASYGKYVIDIIKNNKPISNKHVFVMKLQQAGRVNYPNLANNTFVDLESSGNLKLFKNDSLIDAIRSYYKSDTNFWRQAYISRTAQGLLPKIVEILPFNVQEKIMNSEINRSKKNEIYDIEKSEMLPITDAEFFEVVKKLKTRDDIWFHLKNATRAHLLQIRLTIDSNRKATRIIELLEKTK